jgi:hypothetical protein
MRIDVALQHDRVLIQASCDCGQLQEVRFPLPAHSQSLQQKVGPGPEFGGDICADGIGSSVAFPSEVDRLLLSCVASGDTDREIARALDMPLDRVRYQLRSLIARLAARNRTEAACRAVADGLISVPGGTWVQRDHSRES